jgi:hypothetical protein
VRGALDEYISLTVWSRAGESQDDFSKRLSRFWTHMLRQRKDDFEKVYAETTAFTERQGRWGRQYLLEEAVLEVLEQELAAAGVEHDPVDRDDVYSKYEAVPPDWMQIEH